MPAGGGVTSILNVCPHHARTEMRRAQRCDRAATVASNFGIVARMNMRRHCSRIGRCEANLCHEGAGLCSRCAAPLAEESMSSSRDDESRDARRARRCSPVHVKSCGDSCPMVILARCKCRFTILTGPCRIPCPEQGHRLAISVYIDR